MANIDENSAAAPVEEAVSNPVTETVPTGPGKAEYDELMAEVNRLRGHNTELLGEKKAEAAKRKEAEEQSLREQGEYKALYENVTKERDDWKGKYDGVITEAQQKSVESAFKDKMVELGVKPEAMPLVSHLSSQFKMGPEGPMTEDGQTMATYLEAWSSTDTAKLVIAAPLNSGGGNSNGGVATASSTEGKTFTELSKMVTDGVITQEQMLEAWSKK